MSNARAKRVDLTRMECKSGEMLTNEEILNRVDLTRMECKFSWFFFSVEKVISVDLTRMECKLWIASDKRDICMLV